MRFSLCATIQPPAVRNDNSVTPARRSYYEALRNVNEALRRSRGARRPFRTLIARMVRATARRVVQDPGRAQHAVLPAECREASEARSGGGAPSTAHRAARRIRSSRCSRRSARTGDWSRCLSCRTRKYGSIPVRRCCTQRALLWLPFHRRRAVARKGLAATLGFLISHVKFLFLRLGQL